MKKGGLRLLMAFLCALLVGILGFGSTDVSAAMPGSVDAPKNVTLEYNFDYWDTEPSSLLVRWKNPSSIKKLYSDGEVNVTLQIDWKFSSNDTWKYSESWDRLERKVEYSNWEYIESGWNFDEDASNASILTFESDEDDYWGNPETGYKNVIPKSYLIKLTTGDREITTIDYNKYGVDVRARYLVYQWNEDTGENDYLASDWSDTVSYGNFSKDYDNIDNLLVNPDFEEGLKGWKDPDKVWRTFAVTDVGQARHGRYLVWPSYASQKELSKARIYQDVSLDGYKADETVVFNCLLCNYDQAPHDMGKVTLTFLDKDGKAIETYTQDQRNPNWNSQSIICSIPKEAVTARVSLYAVLYVGSEIDAYYDYCSLVVKHEKIYPVTVTESKNKFKAKKGDKLQLKASNTKSDKASDFIWSSSYNTAATVDANGLVTLRTDAEDGVAIYAKDVSTGVTGVFWINTNAELNAKAEDVSTGTGDNGDTGKSADKPTVAKIKKLSKAKKAFTAKWAKVKGVDGYEIGYSTSKKMKDAVIVDVDSAKTVSKKITGLKGGKKYYVQIRTYAVVDGTKVYSDWSAVKSVKTKK